MAETCSLDMLDQAELARYHAYVFEADRQRHLLAHSLKRQILACLTSKTPASLKFHTGHGGKPCLASEEVHFNISHSGNWVALAFSADRPIGIDIEQARDLDYKSLLTQIAHPQDTLPLCDSRKEQQFLASWSMKEAVAKCSGEGLSIDFPSLRLSPGGSDNYICTRSDATWHVFHLIHEDTHLAVASPQPDQRLRFIQVEMVPR
ncbi:4'-phosphopantetheinyl transferase superfamily protein [Undibacterium pigrum]|uniref:4'-phosphopantetheinyl transferase superfamily protein n=2 Tax=Undibacterium pigrum TaxID=401470 RepID=A0A318JB73_9BURK|nr:4'-phosphopantetheinyl transferase superfamily protein [Undibacterium pigrum]